MTHFARKALVAAAVISALSIAACERHDDTAAVNDAVAANNAHNAAAHPAAAAPAANTATANAAAKSANDAAKSANEAAAANNANAAAKP